MSLILNRRIMVGLVSRILPYSCTLKTTGNKHSDIPSLRPSSRAPHSFSLGMDVKGFQMKNNPSCKLLHMSCVKQGLFEDNKTKDLTIWSNIKQVKSSPVPALSLGASGLLPFVGAPAYMVMHQVYLPNVALAQVAYGATVLAFLGGVRWGFTIPEENLTQPDWLNLGYSVTLSLVAFGGLLLPEPFSLLTMMGGLTLAGYADIAMYGYPPWFKGLRFILTFVAVLSLWTTFLCRVLLVNNETSTKNTHTEP